MLHRFVQFFREMPVRFIILIAVVMGSPLSSMAQTYSISNAAVSPKRVQAGDSVVFTYDMTVQNGTKDQKVVFISLSQDDKYDNKDRTIFDSYGVGTIFTGGSQFVAFHEIVRSIIPADIAAGPYYIFFSLDMATESSMTKISIHTPADLHPGPLTVTPTSVHQGNVIKVYGSVTNDGQSPVRAFTREYFLSTDNKYDTSDSAISSAQSLSPLDSGSTVALDTLQYSLPATIAPGTHYILCYVNKSKTLTESNFNNNVSSGAFTVMQPADLQATKVQITPSVLHPGDIATISCSVKNAGETDASNVSVQYFLSADTIYDNLDLSIDSALSITVPANSSAVAVAAQQYPLPTSIAPGTHYILCYVNKSKTVAESNHSNNVSNSAFTVPTLADLQATKVQITPSVLHPGDIATISCSVKNAGETDASNVSVQYFLSADTIYDNLDLSIDSALSITVPANSSAVAVAAQQYPLPASIAPGTHYILCYVNKSKTVAESNHSNNVSNSAFTVPTLADLQATKVQVTPSVLHPGDTATISCAVKNAGETGASNVSVQYFLSADTVYDNLDLPIPSAFSITVPANSSAVPVTALSYPLPASIAQGTHYILCYVNKSKTLPESNLNNDVSYCAFTVFKLADLKPTNLKATPSVLHSSDTATISCSVINVGETDARNVSVKYFLSADTIYDNLDLSIDSALSITVPANSSAVPFPAQRWTLPAKLAAGTYYILCYVNFDKAVAESDPKNNIAFAKLVVKILPDLQVISGSITPSTNLKPEAITVISCSVINNGGDADTPATIRYFLSTDNSFNEKRDLEFLPAYTVQSLSAGKATSIPGIVYTVPDTTKAGTYYIFFVVNLEKSLAESDSKNNSLSASFVVKAPDLPDLKFRTFVADPPSLLPRGAAVISASITNVGVNTTGAFGIEYFLSSDTVLDSKDSSILKENIPFLAYDSIKNTSVQTYTAPAKAGIYYILCALNQGKDKIPESDYSNNIKAVAIHVPVSVTQQSTSNDSFHLAVAVEHWPADSVTFVYRRISDTTVHSKTLKLMITNKNYSAAIPRSLRDEIGVEYIVTSYEKGKMNTPLMGSFPVKHDAPGLPVTYNSFGIQSANYRIISIPLQLVQSNIDSIMKKSYGHYDKSMWRIFHYENESNMEYMNGIDSIATGRGYWFIARNLPTDSIYSGAGMTVKATSREPYSISLVKGWNQIGNPYNIDLMWSDIKNYPKNQHLESWKKWEGTWLNDDTLRKTEGGIVMASEATTLYFPTQLRKQGQRLGSDAPEPLNAQRWNLSLNVQAGDLIYTLGGIGMHEQASLSKDMLDDLTPPRFMDYLEISFHHPEYFYPSFTKDIVPSLEKYVWEFTVETPVSGKKNIFWDTTYFSSGNKGNNGNRKLFLYDPQMEKIVDMGQHGSYSFTSESSGSFKIFYGPASFIEDSLSAASIRLENPYPNPFTESVTIAVSLPATSEQFDIELDVFNPLGQKIASPANGSYKPGFYEFLWNTSNSLPDHHNRFYIVRLNVYYAGGQKTLSRKLQQK